MKRIVRPAALLVALCLVAAIVAGPAAAAGRTSTTTTPTAKATKAKAKAKKHNAGKHKASVSSKRKAGQGATRVTPNGRIVVGYPKGANSGLDFSSHTVSFGDAVPAGLVAGAAKAKGHGGASGSGSGSGQALVVLAGILLLAGLFGALRSIVRARATRSGDAATTT